MMDSMVMIRQNQLVTVVEHVSALRALEWTVYFLLVNSFNSRNMMDSTIVIRQSHLVTVVEHVSALRAL